MTRKHGTCAKESVRKSQSCKLVAGWMGLTYGVTHGGVGQVLSETRLDVNRNCVALLHVWCPQKPYFWCLGHVICNTPEV